MDTKTAKGILDAIQALAEATSLNDPMACDNRISCLSHKDVHWGDPLTKKVYDRLCPACRCAYHVQAARNYAVEYIRTREP